MVSKNRGGGDAGSPAGERSFGEPVDLSAVMHDEQLINALLRDSEEVPTNSEDEFAIASLFSAARYAVLETPVDFELTDDQIAAAMAQGAPASHTRTRRMLTSLAAGAASVAMVLGGLAIVASNSSEAPNVREGQSLPVVSASMIRADLNEVEDLLDKGDVARGVELINSTTALMEQLDRTAEFDELDRMRVQLWARATGQPEAAAPRVGSAPVQAPAKGGQGRNPGPPAVNQPGPPTFVLPPLPELPELPELPPLPEFLFPALPGPQGQPETEVPEPVTPTTQAPAPAPTSTSTSTPRIPNPPKTPASTTGASAKPGDTDTGD